MGEYDGKQFVGIDLHRQRSVIVRQTDSDEQLGAWLPPTAPCPAT
jgi:hypothetical protein